VRVGGTLHGGSAWGPYELRRRFESILSQSKAGGLNACSLQTPSSLFNGMRLTLVCV